MSRFGNLPFDEGKALQELLKKSYVYLNNVFHKLKQDKRVYVALKLIEKRVPIDVKHSGKVEVDINNLAENVLNPNTRETSSLN